MKALLFTLAVLLPAIVQAGTVPIQDSMKTALPEGLGAEDAGKVIKLAMLELGWLIKNTKGRRFDAEINVRGKHQVQVNVQYDESTVVVSYQSSAGLDYGSCSVFKRSMCIHEHYHYWIENVFTTLPNARQKLELFGLVASKGATQPNDPGETQ